MVVKRRVVDRKTLPEYPFDIGYRWVKNGSAMTQVPLSEEDFLHPQEEDRFLLTDAHSIAVAYLRHALQKTHAGHDGFRVFSAHRIDFQAGGIEPMGPDVIAFGAFHADWNPMIGTLPVGDLALETLLVAEVTSISTRRTDLDRKPDLYRRCRVPYYLIFDLFGGTGIEFESELIAYRRTAKGFVRMKADPEFGVWVPTVEMWFKMEGTLAIAFDKNKNRIPSATELSRLLKAQTERADALEKELADLRAKLAQQPTKKNGYK